MWGRAGETNNMTYTIKMAAAAAVAALGVAGAASAQPGVYGNLGYTYLDADGVNLGAVGARVGVDFMEFLGAEAEFAVGIDDDSGVELDNEWGVFVRGRLPLGESFEAFARVGYADAEVTGATLDGGAAYGAGAQWMFAGPNGVRAEYTRYDFDTDIDAFGIAYVRKFSY